MLTRQLQPDHLHEGPLHTAVARSAQQAMDFQIEYTEHALTSIAAPHSTTTVPSLVTLQHYLVGSTERSGCHSTGMLPELLLLGQAGEAPAHLWAPPLSQESAGRVPDVAGAWPRMMSS